MVRIKIRSRKLRIDEIKYVVALGAGKVIQIYNYSGFLCSKAWLSGQGTFLQPGQNRPPKHPTVWLHQRGRIPGHYTLCSMSRPGT